MAYTTITGNVGKDFELLQSKSGKSFTRFSIAWSERIRDAQGEFIDGPTVWVYVTCFGRVAENAVKSLGKGMRAVVSGQLRAESWARDSGEEMVLTLTADSVGVDLTFQVAAVQKASPGGQSFGSSRAENSSRGGFGQQGGNDVWGSKPSEVGDGEPPF